MSPTIKISELKRKGATDADHCQYKGCKCRADTMWTTKEFIFNLCGHHGRMIEDRQREENLGKSSLSFARDA